MLNTAAHAFYPSTWAEGGCSSVVSLHASATRFRSSAGTLAAGARQRPPERQRPRPVLAVQRRPHFLTERVLRVSLSELLCRIVYPRHRSM